MKRNLKKLGIDVSIRTVQDDSQYRRLEDFGHIDYCKLWFVISPSNEQNYWSSATADQLDSPNYIELKTMY